MIADVLPELDRADELARAAVGAELADLVCRRVEALLAGDDPPEPGSELERACCALADQFVVYVPGVTEELTEPVRRLLGDDGLYGLVCALYVFDARARLRLALERVGA